MTTNVERMTQFWDVWFERKPELYEHWIDPDVYWRIPDLVPWGKIFRGHAGVREYRENGPLKYLRPDGKADFHAIFGEGDKVVDVGEWNGHTLAGKPGNMRFVHVSSWRDGRIVRFEGYYDCASLLRALGTLS